MTKGNIKVATSAVLSGDGLKQLYDVLESKKTPFEARVQKVVKGKRLVTISIEPQHIKHFTDILNNCNGV